MTSEWKLAIEFVKKYNLDVINAFAMRETLKSQGYSIVEFSHASNPKNVDALLTNLKLCEYASSVDAFTYADDKLRIVFILENLSEEEQLILLSHEEGHIFSGNITSVHISGDNVKAENQANEFAHYILQMSRKQRLVSAYYREPVKLRAILAVVLIAVFALGVALSAFVGINIGKAEAKKIYSLVPKQVQTATQDNPQSIDNTKDFSLPVSQAEIVSQNTAQNENAEAEDKTPQENEIASSNVPPSEQISSLPATVEPSQSQQNVQTSQPSSDDNQSQTQEFYYVTANGTKYHKAGCSYIKNKENLKQIPASEIASTGYEPCSRCFK